MEHLRHIVTAALVVVSAGACGEPSGPAAPARPPVTPAPPAAQAPPATDPGIVKIPPIVDPQAIERPPPNVDPGIIEKPPVDATPAAGAGTRLPRPPGSSREDDCRGPAELCKQDSAR